MQTAEVVFSRRDGVVHMTLSAGGSVVADSPSQESIARELQIRGLRLLTIDGLFTTELPTREKTLTQAMDVGFAEKMATLKLIAACAAWGEVVTFPFPERRLRPRNPAPDQ
jgi:serine kinase of HPr protein (carbohydrate metabolism regulator)